MIRKAWLTCFFIYKGVYASTNLCPQELPNTIPALIQIEEACSENGRFYAFLGTVYLQSNRYAEAAISLEKALMLEPGLKGAQLDYAQALSGIGRVDAAQSLVDQILDYADLPSGVRQWLLGQAHAWREDVWQWDWMLQSLVGRETNLNSGPNSRSLNLFLPGGTVMVDLASNQYPRAGYVNLSSFGLHGDRLLGNGQNVSWFVEGSTRAGRDHADGITSIGSYGLYKKTIDSAEVSARLGFSKLWFGGQELFNETDLRLFSEFKPQNLFSGICHLGGGGQLSARTYPQSKALDGKYLGVLGALSCPWRDAHWMVSLQWGRDRANNFERLGGGQGQYGVVANVQQRFKSGNFFLNSQWGKVQDEQIYSTLLGEQRREITRINGRFGYEYPIKNQLVIVSYYEVTSQKSNISLFSMNNQALYLGLRWTGK